MVNEPVRATVLAAKIISRADAGLLGVLKTPLGNGSLGLISTDSDDVSYAALDEATKKANVDVIYAKSMYAGAGNASTRLAGEFIGIIAGPGPEDVMSGLEAATNFIRNDTCFFTADEAGSVVYFAHCISRTGRFLSNQAKVQAGAPLAYLIAPPVEALYALDAALKVAEVELKAFYGPPTETNFAGGLLTGDQAACQAACAEFARVVCAVAAQPLDTLKQEG